jgi:protein-L-isoaspartate(D-aspartate) O-methyltransferase
MTTADGSAPGATPDGGAAAARARLARALRDSGHTPTPAVQAAFAAVPRHLFLPELDPAAVYQDEALVIKYSADGLPVSSSSQPAMMAIMLEQLGLRRGHRVLEIGTGTGYNAAVMAHIVGPAGAVVTVDIDADLIARAQSSLAAAGYGSVRAVQGDGGYGDPRDAPFDRVIVTAGAWDIPPAWLDQLAPGGRLVLPVSVRGIQLSIAMERLEQARRLVRRDRHPPGAERWIAMSAFRCGFVRMAGAFADPEPFRQLGLAPGLYVQTDDGRQLDTRALASAMSGPPVDVGSGVRARSRDEVADLDLWLTLTQPGLSRITIMETSASRAQLGPMLPFGGLARDEGDVLGSGGLGIAGLVGVRPLRPAPSTDPPQSAAAPAAPPPLASVPPVGPDPPPADPLPPADPPPADEQRVYPGEIVVRGYGPAGTALATHLAQQAAVWDARGRPGAAELCLTIWKSDADVSPPAGQIVLTRPHISLAAGWPSR